MRTIRFWFKGIRLYVAAFSFLVTVFVIWWAAVAYGGTILYPTRVEEIFGWLAVGFLAVALSIGPVYKLFYKLPGKLVVNEARRMIGVSATWFALLHTIISYISLFRIANPLSLPLIYKQSFTIGLVALVILLAMAVTSFDSALRKLGIWWFRLHRFVYLTACLVLLHIFMVGSHATSLAAILTLGGLSIFLMLTYTILLWTNRRSISFWQVITIFLMILSLIIIFNYGFASRRSQIAQTNLRSEVPK